MQNKANLLDAQINVSSFITKDYENVHLLERRKNKAKQTQYKANQSQNKPNMNPKQTQSNPNKANLYFLECLIFQPAFLPINKICK